MDYQKKKKSQLVTRRSAIVAGLGALALAVIVVIFTSGRAMPRVDRSALWIEPVAKGDMQREIRASGTLVPKDIRWITTGVEGTIEQILVQPGAQVLADTPVIRMANSSVLSKLSSAKASLEGAKAGVAAKRAELQSKLLDQKAALASAQSEFETTRIKTAAMQTALAAGALSQMDFQQNQVTLEQKKNLLDIEKQRVNTFSASVAAQLAAEQAKQGEAESALQIAQQEVDGLTVRAGIDGILQQVPVEAGQQVTAGQNLARVAQPDKLIARLLVSEVQAKDLALGLPVEIDIHTATTKGKVSRVDPSVKNGSVVVDVDITGQKLAGARPELSVDGRIVLGQLKNVLSIPRPSSVSSGQDSTLFVIKPGQTVAQRTRVKFGPGATDRITVVSGLNPGDSVVLSDTSRWTDAQSLRIDQ
jgi:HlyD family secretion protein